MEEQTKQSFIEVNILEIFSIFKKSYKLIFLLTFIGFLFSLYYSFTANKIYHSVSILAAAEETSFSQSNSSNNTANSLMSLVSSGSIAGGVDKTQLALRFLQTRDFFRVLFQDEYFIRDLMFVESYDEGNKKLNYSSIDSPPSFEDAFRAFHEAHCNVDYNAKTGFIQIKTKHFSPYVAQQWNKMLIDKVNLYHKEKAVDRAEKSLSFFQERLSSAKSSPLSSVYSSGIMNEMQTLSMAAKTDEFAFQIVDSPFLPIQAAEPSRRLILVLGSFLSFIVALLISFLMFIYKKDLFDKYFS